MRFELCLAARHLVSGRGQTLLTVAAVAVAVTVIIFITSLITGLQRRLLDDFIGALPHVTVKPSDRTPAALADVQSPTSSSLLTTHREKQAQQRTDLEEAAKVETQLSQFSGVRAVASAVRGQAFLVRGARRFGVTVSGADPARQEKIVNLQDDMVAGTWIGIGPEDMVIGWRLAEEIGAELGSRVRLESSEGVAGVFTVAGLFDTGQNATDLGQVFVNLRAGQRLFASGRNVSAISLKLEDPFQANAVADSIAGALGYKTESWMREQEQFVSGLRAQSSSSMMISLFALLASSFSIAAVLIVSVMRKAREIGILKSMGAKDRQILTTFALEGLGVAVVGALAGCGTGYALVRLLMTVRQAGRFGRSDALFPVVIDPAIFAIAAMLAILATVLAALHPAYHASRMKPVEILHAG